MHYALDEGRLLFGSEIKALRAAPGFDAAVDLQRIPEVLAFGGVPWPRTMFDGDQAGAAGLHRDVGCDDGPDRAHLLLAPTPLFRR